jgi:hypothetical protein
MKIYVHLVDSVRVTATWLVMLQKKVHDEEKGHVFESAMQIVVTTDEREMASCIIRHADVPNSACGVRPNFIVILLRNSFSV